MKELAVVIVTYNGAKWLMKCINSIDHNYPIIVVDNASTDNTVSLLDSLKRDVFLIQNEENLGFGGANNQGIQKALGLGYSYVFLLNQDAYILENSIELLLQAAKGNPQFGILSPLQLAPEGKELDFTFSKQLKRNHPDFDLTRSGHRLLEVRFVGAACWFVSSEVFKKVGLFHPAFYHYGEDNNWAARAQYHGYKIGVLPSSKVIHDRVQRTNPTTFLPAKLRSFPLHQLLDIRKPFFIAWLVGYYQLKRIWKKIGKDNRDLHSATYHTSRKWFFEDISKALRIRKQLKKPSQPVLRD